MTSDAQNALACIDAAITADDNVSNNFVYNLQNGQPTMPADAAYGLQDEQEAEYTHRREEHIRRVNYMGQQINQRKKRVSGHAILAPLDAKKLARKDTRSLAIRRSGTLLKNASATVEFPVDDAMGSRPLFPALDSTLSLDAPKIDQADLAERKSHLVDQVWSAMDTSTQGDADTTSPVQEWLQQTEAASNSSSRPGSRDLGRRRSSSRRSRSPSHNHQCTAPPYNPYGAIPRVALLDPFAEDEDDAYRDAKLQSSALAGNNEDDAPLQEVDEELASSTLPPPQVPPPTLEPLTVNELLNRLTAVKRNVVVEPTGEYLHRAAIAQSASGRGLATGNARYASSIPNWTLPPSLR
ncbi:hypothetical protein RI367_001491 [Sorochytrium milnesiophthora]